MNQVLISSSRSFYTTALPESKIEDKEHHIESKKEEKGRTTEGKDEVK